MMFLMRVVTLVSMVVGIKTIGSTNNLCPAKRLAVYQLQLQTFWSEQVTGFDNDIHFYEVIRDQSYLCSNFQFNNTEPRGILYLSLFFINWFGGGLGEPPHLILILLDPTSHIHQNHFDVHLRPTRAPPIEIKSKCVRGHGGISDLKSLIVYWTSTPTRHFQNSTHNGALLLSGQKAWVGNSAIFFYVSIFVYNVFIVM